MNIPNSRHPARSPEKRWLEWSGFPQQYQNSTNSIVKGLAESQDFQTREKPKKNTGMIRNIEMIMWELYNEPGRGNGLDGDMGSEKVKSGKSATIWDWDSRRNKDKMRRSVKQERKAGNVVKSGEPLPEPEVWFHDLFRMDGSPYDQAEIEQFKKLTGRSGGLTTAASCVKNPL